MAKIRVHELAKELNITNKAILTKLKAMNIEVKSHMSSLEDETVEYIKQNIFGNKQKEQNSKSGTSVIRRRKQNKNQLTASSVQQKKSEHIFPEKDNKNKSIDKKVISTKQIESELKIFEKSQDIDSAKLEDSFKEDKNITESIPSLENKPLDILDKTVHIENSIDKKLINEVNNKKDDIDENSIKNEPAEKDEYIKEDSKSSLNTLIEDNTIYNKDNSFELKDSLLRQSVLSKEPTLSETKNNDIINITQKIETFNINEADMSVDSENRNGEELIEVEDSNLSKNNFIDEESIKLENVSSIQEKNADLSSVENGTDFESDNDAFSEDTPSSNEKKKKKKKKTKKSEPAKIIKLAIPAPPPPPPPPPPSQQQQQQQQQVVPTTKKREYLDKKTTAKPLLTEREKGLPNKDRTNNRLLGIEKDRTTTDNKSTIQGKERFHTERDRLPFNRDNRIERKNQENIQHAKGRFPFSKDKISTSEKERSGVDKQHFTPEKDHRGQVFEKEKTSYTPSYPNKSSVSNKSSVKSEAPFLKSRIKKEPPIDIPFIPIEPLDKDDIKLKRKKEKDKVKKKKWTDEEDLSENLKLGQKKRKSVVEKKDLYEQEFSNKKSRKKDSKNKQRQKVQQKTQITVPKAIKRRIKIDETIELSELAKRMSIKANEMIQKLMTMGVMVTVNQTIDFDTAALVAAEFDYEVEKAAVAEDMLSHAHEADNPENLTLRPPVVTIMGHVDHGKTSLLDVIRKSKITTGEAGGITQHIGAYSVQTPKGGIVTFLDTPGHAAFTSMRSRGAKITDIVVLVVAADDGVMPQTVEAINHSKAAGVPVLVAVNKMDKPNADPEKVMRELSDHALLSEEWGGDVIFAKVSAKKKQGIDELLDLIILQAEVLELKANPDRLAKGHVVEARLDAGRGPVATVLVQQGTLKTGQPVVCGLHSGKIRIMSDDMGKNIDSAGPSTPVEIVGLSGVPEAGDEFIALASEKDAKNISESRMQKERAKELAKKSRANLEKLFANMGSDQAKQLKLIIKADVHGSLEAINESLIKLSQEEVDVKIVHSGTGAINESDVSLAAVSDAIIIGFNVRPTPKVREMAKEENVDMRFYDIIYNVINDIKMALTGLMPSTFHEIILGRAEVRDTFVIPAKGTIAGCFVVDGKVARGEKIRLLRDGVIKCDSTLSSLRRFKDDSKEVTQGYECGIGIERFNDIKVGDIIECYQVEERKASIDSLKESTPSLTPKQ